MTIFINKFIKQDYKERFMPDNNFSKTFFLAAMFVLIVLTFIIIKPLFIALVSAAIIAYLFYPLYKLINKNINSRKVSAAIIILVIVFILTVPLYFAVNSLTREGYSLFLLAKQRLSEGGLDITDCNENPKPFCELNNKMVMFVKDPQVNFYLSDAVSKFSSYIVDQTSRFIVNLPIVIVNLFVMLFVVYYLLLDGAGFIEKVKSAVPLRTHHVDHIIKEFNDFTYATLYGNLITSGVQGLLGGIIFFALGLSTPILAGLGMAFFAFIPFLGTPIIWVPASIALLVAGETTKAVILLLLGILLISTIDNIIKPEIIGRRTRLHPAAILVGIFGGMFLMGPIGIVVGPLVISLLISFIEVYYKEGLGFNHS